MPSGENGAQKPRRRQAATSRLTADTKKNAENFIHHEAAIIAFTLRMELSGTERTRRMGDISGTAGARCAKNLQLGLSEIMLGRLQELMRPLK